VIHLSLPALRDRGEDFAVLMLEFAKRYGTLYARIESLDPDLLQHLQACRFEGNVRELENAVQRMLFMKGDGSSLTREDWLQQEGGSSAVSGRHDDFLQAIGLLWLGMMQQKIPLPELMRRVESELLQRALQMGGKTRREIAELLHTSERTLYHKISSHGIAPNPRKAVG
jgi:DNA-binding NtrC family response regulator